jgi:sulfite reductase alpha subunit-like flavoprotein
MGGTGEHHLKLVRLRKPKATCSPSYVDHRLKTNAAILWNMVHTKGRPHIGGIGQGKETKNLNVVDVLMVQK